MYDGVNHEPSWLQTKGFSPAKRADLWTSSGAKDIRMESVASGHRVLGDVMSDKAGTLRYVQVRLTIVSLIAKCMHMCARWCDMCTC